MAETKGKKKRLSINLSFLTLTHSTKTTKIFEEPNGVVGLGILAALNDHRHHQDPVFINGCRTLISPKSSSKPIPILTNKSFFYKSSNKSSKKPSPEKMELCEEYTCRQKKDYFEADFWGSNNGSQSRITRNCVSAPLKIADFLNSCFLCQKLLHGLDIFMYRGDKAFCSAECRFSQISIDEQKENRRSGVRKSMEYSVSPLQFLVGVAAA